MSASLRNINDVGSTALVPTRLRFDKSFILTDNNKMKFTHSNVSVSTTEVCVENSDVSILDLPRETRCTRVILAEAKARKINIEEQINNLHHVMQKMDLMYDNKKTNLIKQHEQDRKNQILEVQVASLRKRVMERRDELSEYKQTTETVIYQLHMNFMHLLKEYAEFGGKIKQVAEQQRETEMERIKRRGKKVNMSI